MQLPTPGTQVAVAKWRWLEQMTAHLCPVRRTSDPAAWPMAGRTQLPCSRQSTHSPPIPSRIRNLSVRLCSRELRYTTASSLLCSHIPSALIQRSVASFTCVELRHISALHCACQLPAWAPTLHQPGQPTRLQERAIWRGSAQLLALAMAFIRACLEEEHVQQH